MTTKTCRSNHLPSVPMAMAAAMAACVISTAALPSAHARYSDAWKRCPLLVGGGQPMDRDERMKETDELMYKLGSSAAGDVTSPLLRPSGGGIRLRGLQSSRTPVSSDVVTGPSHITAAFFRAGFGWRSHWWRLRGWWEVEGLMSVVGVSRENQGYPIWGNPGLSVRWGRAQTSSDLTTPFHRALLVGSLTYQPGVWGESDEARELLVARMPFDHTSFSSGHNVSGRLELRLEALGCHEPFLQLSGGFDYTPRLEDDDDGAFQLAMAVGGRPSVASNVMIFVEYAVLRRLRGDREKIAHTFNLGGRLRLGEDRRWDVGLWLSLPAGNRDGLMLTLDVAWLHRNDAVFNPRE